MFEEGKICFCLGGWRKKGKKMFRDGKYVFGRRCPCGPEKAL